MNLNEQQRLIMARIAFLNAKRLYKAAMRDAELALAIRHRVVPTYQGDERVPALLKRQA